MTAALAIFEDLAKSFPDRIEARLWLARAYILAGYRNGGERIPWMKKALAQTDSILKGDPDNGYARYYRYTALVFIRPFTEAEFADMRKLSRQYDHLREIVVPDDDPVARDSV